MNISIEKQNDVSVVVADGRLDAVGAPSLEACGKQLVQEGAKRVLLDMGKVVYISSAGLRSLLVLVKSLKAAGGTLVLCQLAPAVHEVMEFSGFHSILTVTADRASGLAKLV